MTKLKRPLAIILIIAAAFLIAFGIDSLWNFINRQRHPADYQEYVTKYASEYNVPEYIIFAVIEAESDFKPYASSSAGALGLMQILPSTFEYLTSSEHLGENLSCDELYDAEVNIRYGTYYLQYLFRKFHNWDTVIAAYNAGEGNVSKWLENEEYSDGKGNLTYIPFKETRNYVKKVKNLTEYYKNTYYKNEETVK